MNRDLVFFVSGLAFGIASGYFVFRAVSPSAGAPAASEASAMPQSTIGLDDQDRPKELDEREVQALEAKARANPRDTEVRTRIGNLYMEAGRHKDALPWLEEAVRIDGNDLHARNHLAITYLNLGRLEEAVAAFEENLAKDPGHAASLLGLGRIKLYVQQDIQGGLALWEKLAEAAPDSPEAKAVREELEALKSAHEGS
ncbi:MAG TPA: tetratricopeptide repeat protein [Vicinamibacteria bacterium]|nr:tetratricopeptide repeat protein [Vicinamibacteria bacterium]